jgi:predicted DNA-binding transcriptional regulator AlpA
MNNFLKKYAAKILREAADKIDAGTCELDEDQVMEIASTIGHQVLSKDEACSYLNLSRSRFDDLVREEKIPRGRKRRGFKELIWYKDELTEVLRH